MVVGDIAMGTEVLVIGAGPGGYVSAIRAAQLGKDVTLVEKEPTLGGICLNHGCITSKALIHAAGVFDQLQHANVYGIKAKEVSIDVAALQGWKAEVVGKLTAGVAQLCEKNGINVMQGKAVFTSNKSVRVESEYGVNNIDFQDAIIATGSRSIELPALPFDAKTVLSSRQALALKKAPKSLIVIGAGYIGMELGMTYAKLGTKVTVVELLDSILPGVEADLARPVKKNLKALGVETLTGAKATTLKTTKTGASVVVQTQDGEKTLKAEKVLVCVSRQPNTEGLGLDEVGVHTDEGGFITVDEQMRTGNPHVYAIGDVACQPMLAHKASHEGIVAAEAIAGLPSAADFQAMPAVIFTDPEIATVGMTEAQAKAAGYDPKVGKFPFPALGRALTTGEADGFVRIVSDSKTDLVLGAQMVGHEVSNLISEVALAIELAATTQDLVLTVHPHPTMSEGIMEAAGVVLGNAIHIVLPKKK